MNQHIFREYDIRGIVDIDLTLDTVEILARAFATYFLQNNVRRISLGYDARESSPIFCKLLSRVFNEAGLDVLNLSLIPTPLLYFSLFTENVDAGIMITGSHNPSEYNGFKICLNKSTIYGEQIQAVKKIALSGRFASLQKNKNTCEISGNSMEKNIVNNYLDFVAANVKLGNRRLKIVVDAGNGVGAITGLPLYKRLGCEVIGLFTEPDSCFPNHHPDPVVEKNMRFAVEAVKKYEADLAIAFDGDGDRIGIVDEMGKIIWGDELLMIFSRSILKDQPQATFIGEVKCSQRLYDDIKRQGGNAIMWKVGHSLIKAKMKETNAVLAGEMSGHIFFADRFFGFDDAIYAGARLLELLSHTSLKLSDLLADLPTAVNTPEIRIKCDEKRKSDIINHLICEFKKTNQVIEIDGARILFEDGWGLVRSSNTEAVLVLRFEAENQKSLQKIRSLIEDKIYETLRDSKKLFENSYLNP